MGRDPESTARMKAIVILSLILSTSALAASDRLLIKRSARPMMAEGSIEALRPWETPLEGFFVRTHHNSLPTKTDDSWVISFEGLLKKPQKLSLKQLKSKATVQFHAVLECSGNGRALFNPPVSGIQWKRGAVGNAEWRGIPIKDVFGLLGISPTAKYATFEGYDEPVMPSKAKFVRSIPISLLLETGAILAFEMNREPLPVAHGGPVRLVMPNIYGQNWLKWVNKVTFSAEPDSRAYAAKAYRMPTKTLKPGETWDPVKEGRPIDFIKVQTIFTDPKSGDSVLPGTYIARGKAFSGSGPILKVEISMDAGKTWNLAKLAPRKEYSWQEFEFSVDIKDGTQYELISRATDARGNVQPLNQEWNPKGYLYNAADRISFSGSKQQANYTQGIELVTQHCLTCHSQEIIEQQKLTKSDWATVIKKMADYGLNIDSETVDTMASALAQRNTNLDLTGSEDLIVDMSAQPELILPQKSKAGHATRGKKIFSNYCAACHGVDGLGKNGPRLKGRLIPDAIFYSSIKNGKRLMPSFKNQLSNKDIEDVRAWILK
jgi:DMSO/TMAO reductase YedYZ molybdopterin-dependent catalytic subunit/mono/diheme cytochrome c family protein